LSIDGLDAQQLTAPVFVAFDERVGFEERKVRRQPILVIVRRDFGKVWEAQKLSGFGTRYDLHFAGYLRLQRTIQKLSV
jgi:hypothetical protein